MVRIVLVILGLVFSAPAVAKKAKDPGHRPLADYVLTADEVRRLSAEDQLIYLTFLRYLTGVTELSSRASITLDEARSDWRFEFPSGLFSAEAHAALPLIPLAVAGARLAAPHVARALPAMQKAWQGFAAAAKSRLGGKAAEEFISKAAANRRVLIWSTATGVAGEVIHYATDGNPEEAPTSTTIIEEVKEAAPARKPVRAVGNAAEMAKPGSICLFGGHVSEYKTMGDGHVLCTRPKNSVNSAACKGSEEAPKFQCENFGLLNSPDGSVAAQLCINLYSKRGLIDLTERCVAAAKKWFDANRPTRMDAEKYNAFAAKLKAYLTEYESKTTQGETNLAGYCADKNQVNKGRQKSECTAVNGLLAALKDYTGVEQVIAARTAGSVPQAPTGTGGAAGAAK
jgi:hypothetical protein